jgi:hypothetical protein
MLMCRRCVCLTCVTDVENIPLQLKKRDFFKKKALDCHHIIPSRNTKSVNLKELEEKFVTRYQRRIHARGRRNT